MAKTTANVDNYNIASIEKKMEKMSAATASKLGEPEKKQPKQKSTKQGEG